MNRSILIWIEVALFALAVVAMTSCKVCEPMTIVERHDSIVNHYHIDSTFVHDSIYIDRWRANDTTYITKEVWKWRDHTTMKVDTCYLTSENKVVEQVSYTPPFYKTCTVLWWLAVVAFVVWIAVKILKKIYLK